MSPDTQVPSTTHIDHRARHLGRALGDGQVAMERETGSEPARSCLGSIQVPAPEHDALGRE